MLLQVTTGVAVLLALFSQHVKGMERVVVVSEMNAHGDLISDDEDSTASIIIGSGSGSYIFNTLCCIYGNCSCPSLRITLANLTSNAVINITTDVMLSSIIPLVNLANITITGYNNPTVNCNSSGGIHFISCFNCTVEGITWERCGARNITNGGNVYPALQLFNSSNLMINNCTFQHSVGQAVVLLGVSGDVNINHCSFLFNELYLDHGAAIWYSSNHMLTTDSMLHFIITNCSFYYNKGTSVVYFGQSSIKSLEYLCLQNSKFCRNKGVPIYLCNQDLHISGNIKFQRNFGENGGGIVISDHSNVIFHTSARVKFTHNSANHKGGAIYLTNHSSILVKENTILDQDIQPLQTGNISVMFLNNKAEYGGAIYANDSSVTFGESAVVVINDNDANTDGGGVYCVHCNMLVEGNSAVMFKHNHVFGCGGAIYVHDHCSVRFTENSIVAFKDNVAIKRGGAMYVDYFSNVTYEANSSLTYDDVNMADTGGALHASVYCIITFRGNSTVEFNNNAASDGGVLYIDGSSAVLIGDNCIIMFEHNVADHGGTMITNDYSTVTFTDNCTATFNNNQVYNAYGGVAFIDLNSNMTFGGNSIVTFSNNTGDNGGTMYIDFDSTITFDGNSTTTFDNNTATANGGALYMHVYSSVIFKGNSTVRFISNTAYDGGSVFSYKEAVITFQGNSYITFDNNKAFLHGAALYLFTGCFLSFKENSTSIFSYNKALQGGVIYSQLNSHVYFDKTVEFNLLVTQPWKMVEHYTIPKVWLYSMVMQK